MLQQSRPMCAELMLSKQHGKTWKFLAHFFCLYIFFPFRFFSYSRHEKNTYLYSRLQVELEHGFELSAIDHAWSCNQIRNANDTHFSSFFPFSFYVCVEKTSLFFCSLRLVSCAGREEKINQANSTFISLFECENKVCARALFVNVIMSGALSVNASIWCARHERRRSSMSEGSWVLKLMHVEELLAHHTSNVHYTESINNMKAHDMRNCYVINDSFGISFHFGASMIKYVIFGWSFWLVSCRTNLVCMKWNARMEICTQLILSLSVLC